MNHNYIKNLEKIILIFLFTTGIFIPGFIDSKEDKLYLLDKKVNFFSTIRKYLYKYPLEI